MVKIRIYFTGFLLLLLMPLQSWSAVCTTGLVSGLTGSYYNNMTLSGAATGTRVDNSVNFDWGSGSPGVTGIGANNFSVRWTGSVRAPSTGNYRFQTVSDDGVRLTVNGTMIINNWTDHGTTTDTSGTVALVAGQSYPIVLDFYENGGSAVIKLNWSQPDYQGFMPLTTQTGVTADTSSSCVVPCALSGATGKYYNNMTLTGSPTGTRVDNKIAFDWTTGATGVTGVGADNFSVHWDATLSVPVTGSYQFETYSDDGVRVWVNGVKVIDNWTDHAAAFDVSASVSLTAGVNYPVIVEFYENTGYAVMELHWKSPYDSTYVTLPSCPTPLDHYELTVAASGIACLGTDVSVRACSDAAVPCTINSTVNTNVTLATSAGALNATTLTLSSGTSSTKLLYPSAADGASATVSLSGEVTTATNARKCCTGSSSCVVASSCNTTFNTAGFIFANTSTGSGTIANQVAGTTGSSVYLRAVKTSTTTGACTARFTSPQSIQLGYECRNPTTCVAGQTLTLNGTGVQSNANGASIAYTSVPLSFDANGSAAIPFNYTDVGQVKLYARLGLAAASPEPAYTLTGSSNDIVVKPFSLAVTSVQTAASGANPGTTNSGSGFVSAGTAFKVAVQARNASGNPTPNFGNETTSERNSLSLAASSLVYPTGGTLTGLTSSGSFSATTPTGTFVNSSMIWNQVGTITLAPSLSDNDYLGAGNIGTFVSSGNVGRFYPDHYTLTASSATNGCGVFSYMGQPNINLSYTLQAQSLSNGILSNYDNTTQTQAYAATMATPGFVAENSDGANGATLSSRVSVPSATWNHGVMTLTSSAALFNRQTSTAPDGPYSSLQLGMTLADTLDSRSLQTLNMNATTTGACGGSCTAASLGSPLALRYGRARLDDAFGPETVALPVNFVTEYWSSNRFVLNTDDSCTVVPRAAITYPSGTLASDANRTVPLSVGTTQGIYTNLDATGVHMNAGTAGQSFSAPSAAGTGSFIIGIDLTSLSWLRYDWNQDGNYSDTRLPNANFGFGSYRGNDRIIYWREKFQ